jgi:two-component system, OmpR family, sensor histidine kinase KdpD
MAAALALEAIFRLRGLRVAGQCLLACAVLILLTYAGSALRVSSLTMSCLYLLFVVVMATYTGFWQASFTSILAVVLLDYYFVPPVLSFQIGDIRDWVALGTFETAAIIVSRLSDKQLRSASDAAIQRTSMEQLYELSRNLLLLDMRQAPGPQLVVLIQRIFGAKAVALFDVNLQRQDRAGEWDEGDESISKESFLHTSSRVGEQNDISKRELLAGPGPVGALVVRGRLSPLVMNALASLAAIAIDRHQTIEKEERAEAASKGEQLRAAVMDSLAHDFKTPLAAVRTASSGLLEMDGMTELQRDLVTLIDGEIDRLNKLCAQLLVTSKLEAGKVALEKDEVNVQDLVTEVLTSQKSQSISHRVEVAIDDPELTVNVDRALLAMIIEQYLDNARKYSSPGSKIEIGAQRSHTEVLISVHNFGSRVRIQDRERIFDRFYRAGEVENSVSGTGIGLSVVRKAAAAHHGHVWVISDEREGTTFYLSLPTATRRQL